MLISDMETMEDYIDKSNVLSWDGWDVVYLKQDDYAEYLVDGYFDKSNGKWYRKTVYSCGKNGWEIPNAVLR